MSRKRRVEVTRNQKLSIDLRLLDIRTALRSLLFESLNGRAYCADLDEVVRLMNRVDRLRYRFDGYRIAAEDYERAPLIPTAGNKEQ